MKTFTITFTAPDEIMEASLAGLAASYGGHRAKIIDPAWTRPEGEPDEPPLITNPEDRDDFIRRNVLATLTERVVAHRAATAAEAGASAAAAAVKNAAGTMTAE